MNELQSVAEGDLTQEATVTEDITGARTLDDLPKNARDYVLALEKMSGTRISAIGVGPDRDQTIVVRDLISE